MTSLEGAALSQYAKRMARLSARIFGEVARPTDTRSLRVVRLFAAKPIDKSPEIYEYYPRHSELNYLTIQLRNLGLFRSAALASICDYTALRGPEPTFLGGIMQPWHYC